MAGTEDTSRPWVWIVQDRLENPVEGEEVNLMEWDPEAGAYCRSILVAVDPAIRGIDVVRVLQREGLTRNGRSSPDRRSPRLAEHSPSSTKLFPHSVDYNQ